MHVTGSPTLWGSFAFLATVRLPFLFGHVYVLIHVLRTAVVGQRLVLAGRGRDGMRVKPSKTDGHKPARFPRVSPGQGRCLQEGGDFVLLDFN